MSTFNDSTLNDLLTKGEYLTIASTIDASINEIGDEYDSTNISHENALKDAYIFNDILKGLNHNYLESLSNVVTEIKDNDNYGIDTMDKYNELKDKSDKLKTTNENNMKYYIENYLYVIVKVLLIIVLFYLLFKLSLPNIGLLTFNIPLLFKNTGKQINGLRKNIGNQIKQVNDNIKKRKTNSEVSYDKSISKFNSMNNNSNSKSYNEMFATHQLKNKNGNSKKGLITNGYNKTKQTPSMYTKTKPQTVYSVNSNNSNNTTSRNSMNSV